MPILPPQLQPGSYLAKNEPYTLRHNWPDDARVAWGTRSMEGGKLKPADRWAFFEVKLVDPLTFYTCDGANFAECEDAAHAKFQRIMACAEHVFERRGWRNGVGFCIHCDLCSPYAMEPLEHCAVCGHATYYKQRGKKWYCQSHAPEGNLQLDEAEQEQAECELEAVPV
jgi:hypothetical protein